MKRILKFAKERLWLVIGLIAIVGGTLAYFSLSGGSTDLQLVKVARRDLIQIVSVTGAVKAASTINLEFLTSGKVVSRPHVVGDHVSGLTVLMSLDTRDIDFQIEKAAATLAGSRAKLEQLKAGATPEAIKQLENAVVAAHYDALSALDTAITKSDKALSTLRADIFTQNNTLRSEFSLPSDTQTAKAENDKAVADLEIANLHQARGGNDVNIKNLAVLDSIFSYAFFGLETVRVVLVDSSALLRRVVSPTVSQATINTYLDDISGVRSEFDTAAKTFATSVANIQAARDALLVKKEPPRQVDLDVLEANVRSAEADLALLRKQKTDTVLFAPMDGVITSLGFEVGEIARINTTAVSMISSGGIEIEVNVPEVDIAKIAIGNPVAISLDALPGELFTGKVVHIDPAETIVDGVTNYKVKVTFDKKDVRIKTGVTANLEVETLKKVGVLALPQFAIIENDKGTFIRKMQDKKEIEIPVRLGIRSTDGYVEITGGIVEGEEVLNTGLKSATK